MNVTRAKGGAGDISLYAKFRQSQAKSQVTPQAHLRSKLTCLDRDRPQLVFLSPVNP